MFIEAALHATFPRDIAGLIIDYLCQRNWRPEMDEVIAGFGYWGNVPEMMDRHREQRFWIRDYEEVSDMVRDFVTALNEPTTIADMHGWLRYLW
jgi:hypothetical protein